ncbi:hypothetical protein BaRGS_00029684 [Batillaria attramentaria]|uniref:Uncharacterized protein n=1 Tax=Batillaria attramentaria TaxID=370345 RepID=A0ABD0JVH2_9CAEN
MKRPRTGKMKMNVEGALTNTNAPENKKLPFCKFRKCRMGQHEGNGRLMSTDNRVSFTEYYGLRDRPDRPKTVLTEAVVRREMATLISPTPSDQKEMGGERTVN